MTRQLQDAYIVAATRTPVGKAPRGIVPPHASRRHARARAQERARAGAAARPARIDDVIVGCAMPEYEQGMNVARIGLLLAGLPNNVAGMTDQPLLLVGPERGVDRRRPHPHGRGRRRDRRRHREHEHDPDARAPRASTPPCSPRDENVGIAYGMGLTAEKVAAAVEGLARGPGRVRARAAIRRRSPRRPRASSRARSRPYRDRGRARPISRSGEVADARTRVRRATKARAPTRARRGSPSCGPCSPRRAPSPPATARRCPTARARRSSCSERVLQRAQHRAARAMGRLRGRGRGARDHGHRPDRGDPQGAASARALRQDQLDWIELNEAFAAQSTRGDARSRTSIRRRSIRSAAPSRSAIRSAPPARSARRPSCTACAGASRSTAW